MEWVLRSPQIHSIFSNLGFMHVDGYHVNENCNAALETILHNILCEDIYLRPYRRSISYGQNVQKDLIPLLINAKEDKTIELLVRILVILSIPIECLISVEQTSRSDFGLHTVFEINKLLTSIKTAFTEHRPTKVVVEFLKKNVDSVQHKVSAEQCANISNSLLLLRNILHIPENVTSPKPGSNASVHEEQNQILWNIFSYSIDKVLIKLMNMPEATHWGVTMVQLISLLYKDQHVVTLHKLLNIWLETCSSESSEDNESNTSAPDRGCDHYSPTLTSEPTSDSSDAGGSGKSNDEPTCKNNAWRASSENNSMKGMNVNQPFPTPLPDVNEILMRDNDASDATTSDVHMKSDNDEKVSLTSETTDSNYMQTNKVGKKKAVVSETSDRGYGTQIENQESISTSSNDDEIPSKKPVHQKPHNPKQRVNTKARTGITLQDRKRKKIVKRAKAHIVNVQGLTHQAPTDDDISNILKEFTVDFLLRGYNSLVQTLHSEILTNLQLEIDTSHFFWLVTYFLKFATQIELDLEIVTSVLSFDIISYLTAEGVNLCEQFELACKLDGNDLKPSSRRLHLVVTAIREFVQAIEVYKKLPHICAEDRSTLNMLQTKMCETEELRSLLVLLLRHYNPKYHSKQYLQDLIVTNHILLIFLDTAMRSPDYRGSTKMIDHLRQFATPEIMYQYGLLLEDYTLNGEYINDCVFTIMHHVSGELDSLICLFQPKILKIFTSIWKSEYEICDDWSDIIEYVINTFVKKPHTLLRTASFRQDTKIVEDDKFMTELLGENQPVADVDKEKSGQSCACHCSEEGWTEGELSSLSWKYLQCKTQPDMVGEILKCLNEDGTIKSRESVIKGLYRQKLINKEEFEKLSKTEAKSGKASSHSKRPLINKKMRDMEIGKLCEQLRQDGKTQCFDWVQRVLLETCYVKLQIDKRYRKEFDSARDQNDLHIFTKLLKQEIKDCPVMSPVSYHALLFHQSVPLVPWNCEQAAICKDLKFLKLLHKLGFQMPEDTARVFIRIPHFWSADVLYEVANRVATIDTTKLKFSVDDIANNSSTTTTLQADCTMAADLTKDITELISAPNNFYQIHKQKHLAAVVNFTPRPGSSFNSEAQDETNRRCWLEIVQQSQELKLTCSLESDTMTVKAEPEEPAAIPAQVEAAPDLPVLMAQKNSSHFIDRLSDIEDKYSDCETASVASDLTRMYVSDEDEKIELALLPSVKATPAIEEELSSDSGAGPSKRVKVYARPHVLRPTQLHKQLPHSSRRLYRL